MPEESGFYYWDILTEKFNITKESGHGAAQRALKSWFRREEEADLRRFDVTVLQGVPTEVEIEIVRPLAAFDAEWKPTPEEFMAAIEGGAREGEFTQWARDHLADLIQERLISSWDVVLIGNDLIMTFWLG